MPPRDWKFRVRDIIDAVHAIEEYTRNMTFEAFCADRKTVDAVARNFTIIGEAARAMPKQIVANHPEIPWGLMNATRNVLVHVYFGVSETIVWRTIQHDLPLLLAPLQKLLDDEQQ
ncbi:MAG: DUF86 domain-containing protein [Planctomycetaceae bacterium]|nr:DUF86 domain-containing protein [Planctomycetaceae bacterium]